MWGNTVCSSADTTMVAMRNIEVMCDMYSVYSICAVIHYLSTKIKYRKNRSASVVDRVWNVMAGGHQFNRLLTAEVCASAVVMLDTPCSEVVWRVLATHYFRQFPLHLPSHPSPCAIAFQLAKCLQYEGRFLWGSAWGFLLFCTYLLLCQLTFNVFMCV